MILPVSYAIIRAAGPFDSLLDSLRGQIWVLFAKPPFVRPAEHFTSTFLFRGGFHAELSAW
jgi:hypothetical protein